MAIEVRFVVRKEWKRRLCRGMGPGGIRGPVFYKEGVRVAKTTGTATERSPGRPVSLSEMTDGQLVAAHLAGHPVAFGALYERYHDRLVHFIARKTGDRDRAEDLVQEAFIRVTRHLHRFDQNKKFSTW